MHTFSRNGQKRKRAEVAVATDGESINIYDVCLLHFARYCPRPLAKQFPRSKTRSFSPLTPLHRKRICKLRHAASSIKHLNIRQPPELFTRPFGTN